MKVLKCIKCNTQLGEMIKGRIKRGTVLLCKDCYNNDSAFSNLKDIFGKFDK